MDGARAMVLDASSWLCFIAAHASTYRDTSSVRPAPTPGVARLTMKAAPGVPKDPGYPCRYLDLDATFYGPIVLGDLTFLNEVYTLWITQCTLADGFALPEKLRVLVVSLVSTETLCRILRAASGIRRLTLKHNPREPSPMEKQEVRDLVAQLPANVAVTVQKI